MAHKLQSFILELLGCAWQQFGFDITLKPPTGTAIMNLASIYPAEERLGTICMVKACNQTLVDTIRAFDMVVCNVDSTCKHVQMCSVDKEKEMLELEVHYNVSRLRIAWHKQEYERYQQRRVEMGLPRLREGEKRSHWDEGMRLAYLARYGGTAYQAQRVKDIEEQRADFLQIDVDALADAVARRDSMLKSLAGKCLDSVTVVYLNHKHATFNAIMLTLLHFFLLDCSLSGFAVTDACSGRIWVLRNDGVDSGSEESLVLLPASVACVVPDFLPRPATRVAAQANESLAGSEAMTRLHAFALNDVDVEIATRRFYSGQTFLQRVLGSPELYENSRALTYACKADINGAEDKGRPVFFVLVQVMLNIAIEYQREPGDEATIHAKTFFGDFWSESTKKTAAFAENETYLCHGMTLVQYTDVLKELLAHILNEKERALFIDTEK